MIFQQLICVGDSLTTGARAYGCYAAYLANELSLSTNYEWRSFVRAVNGYTTRDVWWMVNAGNADWPQPAQVCLMVGTNDCRQLSNPELVRMYYSQLLCAFEMMGYPVFAATIPPIVSRGRHPYSAKSEQHRLTLNRIIAEEVASADATLVELNHDPAQLIDGVHFTEAGSLYTAKAFAAAILKA